MNIFYEDGLLNRFARCDMMFLEIAGKLQSRGFRCIHGSTKRRFDRRRNNKVRKLDKILRCHVIYSAKDWTSLKEVNILSRFILCRNSSETNIRLLKYLSVKT
jgi:hypothetical protein